MNHPIHPFAEEFPQMQPDEYEALVADIEQHGVKVPVVFYEGKILDGRHRMQAIADIEERTAQEVPYECIRFEGDDAEALAFAYSLNCQRRHLDASQRACIGVSIKRKLQETVKHGGDRRSEEFQGGNISTLNAKVRDIAGAIVSVSGRMIDKAEKLLEEAPDLFERVQAGEMPVSAAENALAIRNGTQTTAQAVKAVAAEIVAAIGAENVSEERLEKVGRVLAGETTNIHVSDDSYEWYTPADVVEAARRTMGEITLDPASNPAAQEVIQARYFFTKEDDGLCQSWQHPMFEEWVRSGGEEYAFQVQAESHCNIFLNPPYSADLVQKFAAKLLRELEDVNVKQAIVLVNNATDTRWFQSLVTHCEAVCFTSGRVKFWTPGEADLQGRQGQAIFFFSQSASAASFAEEFQQFGTILARYA